MRYGDERKLRAEREDQFLRDQYKLHFSRIEKAQDSRWKFVQLSLVGFVAFYAAIFSGKIAFAGAANAVVLMFPVVLSCLGLLHTLAVRQSMKGRSEIMREIEKHFRFSGWQTKREERLASGEADWKRSPLHTLVKAYWLLMSVLSLAVIFFVTKGWISAPPQALS